MQPVTSTTRMRQPKPPLFQVPKIRRSAALTELAVACRLRIGHIWPPCANRSRVAIGLTALRGEHPRAHLASWAGILQADAYGGYGELYRDGREPGPVLEAGCFAHARRKFFELADAEGTARKKSRGERTGQIYPIALQTVQRLDALFDIERTINCRSTADRLAACQEHSAPLMGDLQTWLHAQLARLSRNHDLAKAINYMLRRWPAFTRFLDDGTVCITNNAAERAPRGVALGRKS